jgi:plasmid stability protein
MAAVTIRDVDDALLDWLRAQASAHRRSLNAELLEILSVAQGDQVAASRSGPVAASARKARALGVRTRPSGDLLHEARERRGR